MGLMYPFPVATDEVDFVEVKDNHLVLKTYGLPYIFWIYAICALAVVFFMFLGIQGPILKLVALGDSTDAFLGYGLLSSIGMLPLIVFSFFFYEKRLIAGPRSLRVEHRLFGLRVFFNTYQIEEGDSFNVGPFLDSPNVARLKNDPTEQGFQNKGYFVLSIQSKGKKSVFIDRHSRKADLDKLKSLLESVIKP